MAIFKPDSLTRSDYLWIDPKVAERLRQASEVGSWLKPWFDDLDIHLERVEELSARWADPQQMAWELVQMGIMGTGDSSIGQTDAVRNGTIGEGALKLTATLTLAVLSQMKYVAGFLKVAGFVLNFVKRDLGTRGFLLNYSNEDVTFLLPEPYFENAGDVTGPLARVLPQRQDIAHPMGNGEIVKGCVAMQLFSANNSSGFSHVETSYILRRPDGSHTGVAFGMPKSLGADKKSGNIGIDHIVIAPSPTDNAQTFFTQYREGTFGPPAEKMKSNDGYGSITRSDMRASTRNTTFGIVFQPKK